MSRIPYPDPRAHPDDVRLALAALPALNIFSAISTAPTLLLPWLGLGGALLTSLDLDPATRELAVLEVAATLHSPYEQAQHEAIAAAVGVTSERIVAVREDRLDDACLSDIRELLLAVRQTVVEGRATGASLDVMRSHLGDRQTVELLMTVGYYVAVAMLAGSLDIELDAVADTSFLDDAGLLLQAQS